MHQYKVSFYYRKPEEDKHTKNFPSKMEITLSLSERLSDQSAGYHVGNNEHKNRLKNIAASQSGIPIERISPNDFNITYLGSDATSQGSSNSQRDYKEQLKREKAQHKKEDDELDEEWERMTGKSSSNSKGVGGLLASGAGALFNELTKEKSQAEIDAELEQSKIDAQERIERAKIDLEKEKLKVEKAERLRSEGKNIQAFMLMNPVWTGLIGLGSLFLVLLLVGGIMQFSASNKESNSLAKSQELEKIESQIIIGITSKEPKEKLLELVNSLQHDDNKNYITGKKYELIKNIYTLDPNFEFNGTYSDYWGKLREAYKEIITTGLTIEEYKAKLYKDNKADKTENNSVAPTAIADTTTTKQITNDNEVAPIALDTTTATDVSNNVTGFGLANKAKVFFYTEADNSTIRKAYITKGEKVNINNKVGDFYEVTYTSNAGNETKGYMLTSDIDLQN